MKSLTASLTPSNVAKFMLELGESELWNVATISMQPSKRGIHEGRQDLLISVPDFAADLLTASFHDGLMRGWTQFHLTPVELTELQTNAKLVEQVKRAVALSRLGKQTGNWSVERRFMKLVEETGELSEALLYAQGLLPNKEMKEPVSGEIADVTIQAIDVAAKHYESQTPKVVLEIFVAELERKLNKWQGLLDQVGRAVKT